MATPCQLLGYTLPSPWVELAERKRNLEQSQAGKLSNETSRKSVLRVRRGSEEGKKRVRRGKEEGENFEPTIKTFQKSEPMFIASRTYVHWHMNLCSSSHEPMFVLPRGFRASPLSPHRGHRPTISPSGKHPTDTNFIHF